MHTTNLKGVLAFLNNIVVKLVPQTCRREFWARELGQGVEIHAVDVQTEDIEDEESKEGNEIGQGQEFHCPFLEQMMKKSRM